MAWQNGRYDDAGSILTDEALRDFLPAKKLARDVAGKIIERAGNRFARGDSAAGWKDLAIADRLGGQTDAIGRARLSYADQAMHEVRQYLAAGQAVPALTRLEKLQQRGLADEAARLCRQVAQQMHEAEVSADHGHFAEAAAAIGRAASIARLNAKESDTMHDIVARLDAENGQFARLAGECQRLSAEMHGALTVENWGAVLTAADALLAIAPQHAAAAQARRRAWKAVGMDVTQQHLRRRPAQLVSLTFDKAAGRVGRRSTRPTSLSSEVDTVAGNEQPQRSLLWVDAVGGFLVCLDDAVVIGQPSPGNAIALPILADLSRRHAVIRRDAGAYVLEPLAAAAATRVDGREIGGPVVLSDNQLIQLGDNVRLRFTKPHALSATVRLTLESHHKTQPSADGVLLMADSCVLGPNRHCHVQCRDWQRDVVVYRQDNRVYCRADEPLAIDGVVSGNESEIQSGVRVEGEEFSFAWETVV